MRLPVPVRPSSFELHCRGHWPQTPASGSVGCAAGGHWPEAEPLPVLAHAVLHRQIQEPRDQRPWSGILRVAFSYRVPSGQAVCSAVHH